MIVATLNDELVDGVVVRVTKVRTVAVLTPVLALLVHTWTNPADLMEVVVGILPAQFDLVCAGVETGLDHWAIIVVPIVACITNLSARVVCITTVAPATACGTCMAS